MHNLFDLISDFFAFIHKLFNLKPNLSNPINYLFHQINYLFTLFLTIEAFVNFFNVVNKLLNFIHQLFLKLHTAKVSILTIILSIFT